MTVTMTNSVTLACDTQAEYDSCEDKVDNYLPNIGEPDMTDIVKDATNKVITYTMTKTE